MAFPKIGNIAPNFSLKNQSNEVIQLKDLKGKSNVLVYFYPKADTPGCTAQACGMRDYHEELKRLNTRVLAISPDSPAKLQKFDTKYNLDFDLLSDEDHAVAELYGVWGLKKFMGREFMGIIRTSFVIDQSGRLVNILEKVNTKTHGDKVIEYIKSLL
ncbi:thioredoxin-dependent thiol peroxidase [Cellvibrio sp.]|uniref:thioredoxin-dependent thiol peroxidase n=1 Tax=Cellvibrio sp. TaxID=1965322 RepID=UPI0039648BD4